MNIQVDKKTYNELKKLYNKAIKDNKEVFLYKRHEILVAYCKYLLEYFKLTLKPKIK